MDYKRAVSIMDRISRKGLPSQRYLGTTYLGRPSITGMSSYLHEIGLSEALVDRLNPVHVAGTKGKGSVCAITHQILVGRSKKVGLYTSPSIFSIEDRIKINGQAVPQDQFAKTTLLLYNKLGDSPRKNQLLFLVALAIFKEENVDVAIIETHFGGRYDSTNVIRNPVATGITTIGLDHVQGLGGSLEMIAWNKAGIFKTGSPAFSSPQTDSVEKILMKEAFIKNVELTITKPTSQSSIKDEVHAVNSSLAVKLAEACLRRFDDLRPVSANEIIEAIKLLPKQMPGRFHVIEAGPSKWFLDIAHNELSISVSARWFVEEVKHGTRPRAVIFHHPFHPWKRDAFATAEVLVQTLNHIKLDHIIVLNAGEAQEKYIPLLARVPHNHLTIIESVSDVVKFTQRLGMMDILVTGNPSLVADIMSLLHGNTSGSVQTQQFRDK